VRLEEPGEEIPDGGAAVVEDVVAAAAGAVVDGEADGVGEVVDVGGDDAVPAAVDRRIWPARTACTKLTVDGSSVVPQTQPGRITTVVIWAALAA
jgi:hypothetical protein